MPKTSASFQEIETMKQLSQQAAAWALGLSARTLRDRPEIPRGADGYDVRDLVKWATTQGPQDKITFDDELLERVYLTADAVACASGPHVAALVSLLERVKKKHGAPGMLAFVEVFKGRLIELDDTRPEDVAGIDATIEEVLDLGRQELAKRQRQRAHNALRVIVRCGKCGRARGGDRWLQGVETPSTWVDQITVCPECEGE